MIVSCLGQMATFASFSSRVIIWHASITHRTLFFLSSRGTDEPTALGQCFSDKPLCCAGSCDAMAGVFLAELAGRVSSPRTPLDENRLGGVPRWVCPEALPDQAHIM
ncbi:hypothetical protein PAPYR_10286 [Paratrimastix pyriformis]|uniref:Uncharacterized protein n=1 Tax=Paratrimastix pyriformis TaxID=342808 RepID=A0ABQ8U690_9EUKA|nr:hypothetical protein PAPYR_10286 [Paratrimastix pyriformis]